MKIELISDIHNKISQIKLAGADLLMIAGDLTMSGTTKEYIKLNADLENIRPLYKYGIVAINGNHDWLSFRDFGAARMLTPNIDHMLQDSMVEIAGIKIYGSAWNKWFHSWAWNVMPGPESKAKWDLIPECDIVMTHGPVYGKCDKVQDGEHVGDKDLLEAILRVKPKFFICGHIHEAYSIEKDENTTYINCSTCDLKYNPVNKPIIIEI